MSLERGRIASSQLTVMVVGFVLGSSLVNRPTSTADDWLSLILGIGEGLVIAIPYLALAARFPGATLDRIFEQVFGYAVGKASALVFAWYLFHLGSLVLGNFVYFYQSTLMPQTPLLVIASMIALSAASAVRNGVEVLARCTQALMLLVVSQITVVTLLATSAFDTRRFFPVLDTPLTAILRLARAFGAFPFGEVVAFMMVIPFVNKQSQTNSAVLRGLLAGGLLLLLVIIRDTGVLGRTAAIFPYPNYQAAKLVNFGRYFTRIEILVAATMVAAGFVKISVLLYGTVLALSQMAELHSYLPLVLPTTILMVILSIMNFPNLPEQNRFAVEVYPWYSLPFQVGIPLVTLVVAVLRRLPRRKDEII